MNRSTIIRLLMLAVLIGVIAIAGQYQETLNVETLSSMLDGLGVWAPVTFIALFALASVAFLPGMVFALAGGVMFGPVLGTAYNLTGATIGAVLACVAHGAHIVRVHDVAPVVDALRACEGCC